MQLPVGQGIGPAYPCNSSSLGIITLILPSFMILTIILIVRELKTRHSGGDVVGLSTEYLGRARERGKIKETLALRRRLLVRIHNPLSISLQLPNTFVGNGDVWQLLREIESEISGLSCR